MVASAWTTISGIWTTIREFAPTDIVNCLSALFVFTCAVAVKRMVFK